MTAVKMLWGPAAIGFATIQGLALSTTNLNNATNAAGCAFCLPKDGTITDVGFLVTSEVGTSPAYNAGLVTLDANGRPTTTAYGGSAITAHTATATGWQWVTLSTPATAAAGDFAAVHVYPSGTTPDGSNYIAIEYGPVANGGVAQLNSSSTWSGYNGANSMAVRYSGGEVFGYALGSNTIHVQVRANTTPDEVGCKFSLPAAMTCTGARFAAAMTTSWGSAAAVDVILYSAADAVLASASISDKDYVDDTAYINVFWDAVNLSAATDYRLVVKPTIAANGDVYLTKWTFESTAARAFVPCGADWQWTERTDGGAWTDTNTAIAPLGLWVSDITFSAGASGGEFAYIG